MTTRLRLELIEQLPLAAWTKGFSADDQELKLGDIASRGWNLLDGQLPLPLATLRESALRRNSAWMRAYVAATGARLCPHGKTTMAPQLFQRQLDDGAWGLTAATAGHVRTYRHFGVPRILLANQLVEPAGIAYVLAELARDPDFDFYCLVDSEVGAQRLAAAVRASGLARPLQVLIEVGAPQGRAGVRGVEQGLALARRLQALAPALALRGIECYEGIFGGPPEQQPPRIAELLSDSRALLQACGAEQLFAPGTVLLSAGGSAYFDLVARDYAGLIDPAVQLILRSGCYLSHDSGFYARALQDIRGRGLQPALTELPAPVPALQVWAAVQSLPEPGLMVAGFGKRDVSHDLDLPVLEAWYRPGLHARPVPVASGRLLRLYDQHACIAVPEDAAYEVGDLIAVGVSHPCTTFDKWPLLALIDDDYRVLEGIRTFF
ncbi:hypothetical protein ED208_12985 [Stagnimonas aquatica]|uniref:D-serine dehydratase-like domain-containing protein n=1 Tax=Stagnimonas aquatica TaxID=2689987 RepID=A0A3N0V7R2_9GAMM|nr:alanine racemase [Stagnimonas aquatica]ROH88725.1 hypothetical protein ED208_12985 [Stagnimonas aquatica]